MTNEQFIKSMKTDELARFINVPYIACNDLCPDRGTGCAFSCTHNQGVDVIREWLTEEMQVEEFGTITNIWREVN